MPDGTNQPIERRSTPRGQARTMEGMTVDELYRMFTRFEQQISDGTTAIRRDQAEDMKIMGEVIDKMTNRFDTRINELTGSLLSSAVYMADMKARDDRVKRLEDSMTFLNRTVAGALITIITGVLVVLTTGLKF